MKHKILKPFLLLLCFVIAGYAYTQFIRSGSIHEINSFDVVDFNKIGSAGALVLFDVDETLIQPEDGYVRNAHSQRAKDFRESLKQRYSDIKDWNKLAGIILIEAKRPLIEPQVIDKIAILKKRRMTILAITAMNTGKHEPYGRLEEWRYQHLKSLGFQGDFQDQSFPIEGFGARPVFYKGIIATDLEPKGKVLGVVLDKLKLMPSEILMFDDHLDFLESVEKECQKRHIAFVGFHYKGAKKRLWDQDLIEFQADHLIHHQKWLSDQEASILMKDQYYRKEN